MNMTLYQFYCAACDRESEANISIEKRDEPLECECGNIRYRKISFKGVVYSGTHNGGMK